MTNRFWTAQEDDIIEKMVGYFTIHQIVKKLNKWHRKQATGITRRRQAVQKRINYLGYSSIPSEDNMTTGLWAKQLGISKVRLDNYRRFNGLQGTKISYNKTIISIKQMTDMLEEHPHLLSDVNPDILVYYFGEELTNKILAHKVVRDKIVKIPAKVKRVDNGMVYPSLRVAEKNLKMSRCAITAETKRNGWLRKVN